MSTDLMGFTSTGGDEIWLRADVPPDLQFQLTVAHETRHLYQAIHDPALFNDMARAELDAHEYSFEAFELFRARTEPPDVATGEDLSARHAQAVRFVVADNIARQIYDALAQERHRRAQNPEEQSEVF